MPKRDEVWYSEEVEGDPQDVVVEVILTHKPGTFVVVSDGDDPDSGTAYARFIVPEWGVA